ncbi:BREX system Lon protease-like protein BrxL [Pseudoflavonifractor phocaeensis]|uniref:BREX system Lon protease-like protein BrxL n=1 Tax=Pseudoflavonifractor phocaeensis TaxID=1870988 RepID=UPI0019581EF2|nr:BREX system Lon protease-like protein BrxL [Pseudoflavonifractor phocaeensis]MBM6926377.1 ATP-dependent protease [Pseudoflavonifractor phocaeensis]
MYDTEKLRKVFPQTSIYKDRSTNAIFKAAKIEAFLRDWIIRKKAGPDGRVADTEALSQYIDSVIPRQSERGALEDAARSNGETRPFLAKINISFNSNANYYCFELPDLGFSFSNTIIEDYVWERVKDDLLKESGGWGLLKLGYMPPEENKKNGRFTLLDFKNFCPYTVRLDTYRRARAAYDDTEEWMDILLGAIDYCADGFQKQGNPAADTWLAKHTMLTRLLPFVEPRVNLIELAPQQTGKSYIFGKIGKYGWLAGGGSLSRAKLFLDMRPGAKARGLVTFNDFVAIDEIKSISFSNDKEMAGIFKGYMEDGFVNVGGNRVDGDAGIIFLGNIDVNDMDARKDMFRELPDIFRDSALLQRIHGFIPGKYIPALSPNMYMDGWALNTEYFTEILHQLRTPAETMRYRAIVEELVTIQGSDISGREQEAVLRICTAYLKLFFPHASKEMVNALKFKQDFNRYCLQPAKQMQFTVLEQLKIINPNEFGAKQMASYAVRND